ncbi:MAG: hypothetical protein Q8P20_01015 [bacterium]|nr:hypothetical protein [bacterium]MDZ4228049.1 hypothetical protein [Candidatus Levybacteria bacterium]
MFEDAKKGDSFYSLKYRRWFEIEDVDVYGVVAYIMAEDRPVYWNFKGYLLADMVQGYPDAMWVKPDFREAENVRPRRKRSCTVERDVYVNVYPKTDGSRVPEIIYTEEGSSLNLHTTEEQARSNLAAGGKTYPAKCTLIYEVEE